VWSVVVFSPVVSNLTRTPLGRAHMLASSAVHQVRKAGIKVELLTPVGGVRRFAPDVGDISVLAAAPSAQHEQLLKAFGKLPLASRVLSKTSSSATISTDRGGEVTFLLTTPEDVGAALVWHTGSRRHVDQLQHRAERRGLSFVEGRLAGVSGDPITCATEEELYRQLDLPCIPPELRHGDDEVAAAEERALPELISDVHIRGDLHVHTTWSDGRNSIEEMAREAERLGYEYLAITDHSPSAFTTRSVRAEDVAPQREEIEALRQRTPRLQILHGIEADILHDGTLDFDDDVIAQFDIVLASLHRHDGDDGARLTARYLRAIANPFVNVITHPANRSPAGWPGYDVDFDRLFGAAVETGTAMEIDGAPGHLDMDGAVARRAVAAGVTIVINSDGHRADGLARQMRFGVGTARRGWVEPGHVLNTGRAEAVRQFVARKRQRG
jgi:DNA polymerase (family 10)